MCVLCIGNFLSCYIRKILITVWKYWTYLARETCHLFLSRSPLKHRFLLSRFMWVVIFLICSIWFAFNLYFHSQHQTAVGIPDSFSTCYAAATLSVLGKIAYVRTLMDKYANESSALQAMKLLLSASKTKVIQSAVYVLKLLTDCKDNEQ